MNGHCCTAAEAKIDASDMTLLVALCSNAFVLCVIFKKTSCLCRLALSRPLPDLPDSDKLPEKDDLPDTDNLLDEFSPIKDTTKYDVNARTITPDRNSRGSNRGRVNNRGRGK